MKVKVIAEKWGSYKKGDELELADSTAKAIAKHGNIVELVDADEAEKPKKVKKQ